MYLPSVFSYGNPWRYRSRDKSCAYVTADSELTAKRFCGIISSATWQMETALSRGTLDNQTEYLRGEYFKVPGSSHYFPRRRLSASMACHEVCIIITLLLVADEFALIIPLVFYLSYDKVFRDFWSAISIVCSSWKRFKLNVDAPELWKLYDAWKIACDVIDHISRSLSGVCLSH